MVSKSVEFQLTRCTDSTKFQDDSLKCHNKSAIDEWVKGITIDVWKENEMLNIEKFSGKPTSHVKNLISSSYLGTEVTDENQVQIQKHELEMHDNYIQFGFPSYEGDFYDVHTVISRPKYRHPESDLLYQTTYMLSNVMMGHEREVESLIQLMGDIGGLIEFLFVIFLAILSPIAEFDFYLKAIKKLYYARSRDGNILNTKDGCELQA